MSTTTSTSAQDTNPDTDQKNDKKNNNVPSWFADAVAALSVALVLIPQSLAYAELAGMPAHYGLYASALPPIAAAFFASSPFLQTGPTALTAILTAGALSSLFTPASPAYVTAAALLALIVGIWRIAIGLLRLGSIAYFMSQPVLRGFTTAAALLIVSSQLPAAVGVSPPEGQVVQELLWTLQNIASWQPWSMVMAGVAAACIILSKRVSPLLPGVFIAVVITTVSSRISNYQGNTVGTVNGQLLQVSLAHPWQLFPQLLVSGLVIAVVGFAEATSIARAFAAETRTRWQPNREFISQGVANVASSLVSGFPVGGSFSRSALSRTAGTRTRWSGAMTGLLVFAALPLMPLLAALPSSVLAAIVMVSVVKLIRFRPLMSLWRLSRPQFVTAWLTFLATMVFSPRLDYAILLGISASLLIHLYREMDLEVSSYYEDDTLYVVLSGVLWFGSTQRLEDALATIFERQVTINNLIIDARGLGHTDLSGAMALVDSLRDARAQGINLEIQGLSPRLNQLITDLERVQP